MSTAFFKEAVAEQLVQCARSDHRARSCRSKPSRLCNFSPKFSRSASQSARRHNSSRQLSTFKTLIFAYGEQLLWNCLHGTIFELTANLRYDVARLIQDAHSHCAKGERFFVFVVFCLSAKAAKKRLSSSSIALLAEFAPMARIVHRKVATRLRLICDFRSA